MTVKNNFVVKDDFIKSFYDNFGDYIQPKNINEVHLKGEKIRRLYIDSNSLKNFRNNELSYLTGALIYPDVNRGTWFSRGVIRHYFGSLLDLFKYKYQVKKICKDLKVCFYDNKEDDIGNPIKYSFLIFEETGTNIYNNFIFSLISNVIDQIKPYSILEIGSGFGKLASLIINKYKKLSYSIIEYPSQSIITYYYLKNKLHNNNNLNILSKFDQINECEGNKINIFPSLLINSNKKIPYPIDTILNIESFQHMQSNEILDYVKFFKLNGIKRIISFNRDFPIYDSETNFYKIFNDNGFTINNNYSLNIKATGFSIDKHKLDVFEKNDNKWLSQY